MRRRGDRVRAGLYLLGRLGADLDFTTDARPGDSLRLVRPWADAVWETGLVFGTVGAKKGDFVCEVTTYRAEAYDRTSRKPVVSFGDSLEDDLLRRDFTVNAMAVTLPAKQFVDPFGGLRDLAALVGGVGAEEVYLESLQRGGAFSTMSITGRQLRDPRTMVALLVNGADLSLDHGFPARLIIPGAPGVRNTKWLSTITFQPEVQA